MDPENMTREELIMQLKEMNDYMDNVIVLWGDKRGLRETLEEVARNESGDYTAEEARNADVILSNPGAFDSLIELVRDSFDRGGINYVVSEKVSDLMQEVAARYGNP